MLFSESIIPFSSTACRAKVIFFIVTETIPANSPITKLNKNTKFFSEMCLYLQMSKRLKKLDLVGIL
ncbi:hypothetical protein WPG_1003 [Winogradskyella sp. PG-2]|nr:hypothetical protein WPG_1003 [Winogradskyella sp. PG-2]